MNHTTRDTRIFRWFGNAYIHPSRCEVTHTHTRNRIAKHTHTHTHKHTVYRLATHTHTRSALYREHTHCFSQIKYTQDHAPSCAQKNELKKSKS